MANVPMNQTGQQYSCEDSRSRTKAKADLDVCEIVKRTRQNEQNKHSEYECHLKGERRQNLINKIKMYLDDYDDRPVMKSAGKKEDHTAKGQTGFGPMIKYPGYVDYNHPYFSDPYNKMPNLAMTVGQQSGQNPCPPISVRNYDTGHGDGGAGSAGSQGARDPQEGRGCHCARRRSEDARCPAASSSQPHPRQRMNAQQWSQSETLGQTAGAPAMVCLCRTVSEDAKGPADSTPQQPHPRQRRNAQQWSRIDLTGGQCGAAPAAPAAYAPAMVCLCRTAN